MLKFRKKDLSLQREKIKGYEKRKLQAKGG